MNGTFLRPLLIPLLLAIGGLAGAQVPEAADGATTAAEPLELLAPMRVVDLENGMRFLLYPVRRAPIISGVIRFDVGGKDELPGSTGIAHMFEHMAFKGTSTLGTTGIEAERVALAEVERAAAAYDSARNRLAEVGQPTPEQLAELEELRARFEEAQRKAGEYVVKNEFDEIYSREGSSGMNATTSADATTYFVSLPANRLELWARMESSRLSDPVLREFYQERAVVMEERRMRRDNSPIGQLWDLVMAVAFVAHPYGYPTIGWEDDIANLKATAAKEFFRTHYTPDRAVGAIVGDIDLDATEKLLRETFGKLPPRPADQPEHRVVQEPPQQGERRAILRIEATPILLMGWHKPSAPDPADLRAEVLMQVLSGGRSARWVDQFVKREQLAADIGAFSGPGDADANLFMVYATPREEVTLERLEQAIRAEVARLRTEPVAAEELERARRILRADTMRAMETNMGLASSLAEYAQTGKDPYYLERRLRQLEQVTAEDLLGFAREYLVDTNLTVGLLSPPEPEAGAGPAHGDAATTGPASAGGDTQKSPR